MESSESAEQRRAPHDEVRADLQLLVDTVRDYAIFLLDPAGRVSTWSTGAREIIGYEAHEILGRHFSVFYPPEEVAGGKPDQELVIAAREGRFEDEGWRVRKDGTRFWASVVITSLRSPTGELRGFGKIERDLSQRWLSTRLEDVLQSLADGVTVQDRDGQLVWANRSAARMAGVRSGEELVALGHGRNDLFDESGRPISAADLPAARLVRAEPDGPMVVRVRQQATGQVWWASVRASAIRGLDGRPQLVVTIWHDVTEDRRRQEVTRFLAGATVVLSESLDYTATMGRLARLLVPELADWCMVDIVEDGQLRSVAVSHVHPEKVALAQRLRERRPTSVEDPTGPATVIRTGEPRLTPEISDERLAAWVRGDPELLPVVRELGLRSVIIVPLKAHEQTLGAMTLISAESGRRYDEDDLALAMELGRRAGIAIENARAFREARDAIRLRDEFLSVAGHELRTPLTALQLQLQSLDAAFTRGQVAADLPRWGARLHKTVRHALRLQRLIDELLDVSRITSGRLALEREELDLAELAREVIERHAPEAQRCGSTVDLETSGRTTGRWDRARLDQVITNLLSNSLKYGQGKPVRVQVAGEGDRVRLVVRDEGIGIQASAHARIFGRFERAVSERHYGGFGLGLWIVRELVEAHGGRVGFESEPERGSTFWVELPFEVARG